MRRDVTAFCGLVLVAVTVTACGSGTHATARKPPPQPTREVKSLLLPFDAYELSQGEYNAAANAADVLIAACLEKKGMDWPLITRPTGIPNLANRRRYGVVELEVARRYGYEAPEELRDPYGTRNAEQRRDAQSTPAVQQAVDGSTGCSGQAQRTLHSGDTDYGLLNRLSPQYLRDARSAPAVIEAMGAWRACLRTKGFSYTDPYDAVEDKRWADTGDEAKAGKTETAAAVADVECKQKTGLVTAWFAAEKILEEKGIKQNKGYFEKLARDKARNMDAVHKVLAGAGIIQDG